MSADLIWELVKGHNRFVVRRNGANFSSEPGNLRNINSFKYSGLAHAKTVDISMVAKHPRKLLLTKKSTKPEEQSRPATVLKKQIVKKGIRRQVTVVSKLLKHYRPDLIKAAKARASQINLVRASGLKHARKVAKKNKALKAKADAVAKAE